MAGYEASVGPELLPGLLAGEDGLAKLVETVLNQVLGAQATDALGAERSGIGADGCRQILGVRIGDAEGVATWDETFRWLQQRGLKGVGFVISDAHGGLTEAIAKHFQGATWQRGQVHLMRNLLAHASTCIRAEGAATVKLALQAPDMDEARRRLQTFAERFAQSAPKAVACLEDGYEDAMAVMALPEKYRRWLRTSNMQERLHEEVRRREKVIRLFPNDDSALRCRTIAGWTQVFRYGRIPAVGRGAYRGRSNPHRGRPAGLCPAPWCSFRRRWYPGRLGCSVSLP